MVGGKSHGLHIKPQGVTLSVGAAIDKRIGSTCKTLVETGSTVQIIIEIQSARLGIVHFQVFLS